MSASAAAFFANESAQKALVLNDSAKPFHICLHLKNIAITGVALEDRTLTYSLAVDDKIIASSDSVTEHKDNFDVNHVRT